MDGETGPEGAVIHARAHRMRTPTPAAPRPVLPAPGPQDWVRSTHRPEVGCRSCNIGPCSPARPQVSQEPFFRGSLRRGHTSPWAASCLGQTMTFAGIWCQLAAAVANALTSCLQREVILAPRGLGLASPGQELRTWKGPHLNSVIPSGTDRTHVNSFCLPGFSWLPGTQIRKGKS